MTNLWAILCVDVWLNHKGPWRPRRSYWRSKLAKPPHPYQRPCRLSPSLMASATPCVCVCVRVKPGYKWTLKFCRGTGDDWPIQRSHVAFRCAAPSWLDDVNYVNISLDSFTIPFAQGRFLQLFWQVVQWSIEYCKVPCSCEPSSKCVFAASPHCGVLSFGRRIHTRILTAFSSQHDTPCYFGSTSKMLLPSCKATGCFMIFDGTQR